MRLFYNYLLLSLLLTTSLSLQAQEPEEEPTGPWPFPMARPEMTDETSLKLIDLHLKARGGRMALERVRTITAEGKLWEGKKESAIEVTYGTTRRIKILIDYFSRGYHYITLKGTDGENAWTQNLEPEKRSPRPIGGFEKQLLELDACLPFLLLHHDQLGAVFKYTGEDTFAKQKVYVMHGWLKNGLEVEVLLDPKSFQVINYRQPFKIGDQTLIVDRMPIGLTRIMETWWEKGYNYALRGKGMQKIIYNKMKGSPYGDPEQFKQPPSEERWLRSNP